MNLYKITFRHYAPKEGENGIKGLLLAENDEQVYNWFASNPEIDGDTLYTNYKEHEKYKWNEESGAYVDEDGHEEYWDYTDENDNQEEFKDHMIRVRGEINTEYEVEDAYYGFIVYGWELVKENITTDYSELIETGIMKIAK